MPNIVYSVRLAKPVIWLGTSHTDLKGMPALAQRRLGFDLGEVQRGQSPRDWKPMPAVGPGGRELRIRVGGSFRMIYLATFPEAVYVLHVFQKKSHKTSRSDLQLARARLALVLSSRP